MPVRKQSEESCGNGGAMESVESQKQASPSFHSPLEISPKTGEIPTFPQLRRLRGGKVEKQQQLSHFPTAFSISQKTNRRAGFAHRPPGDLSTWPSWGSFYLALTENAENAENAKTGDRRGVSPAKSIHSADANAGSADAVGTTF
jgi:hypothetical protein